jgi:hypothetical protein
LVVGSAYPVHEPPPLLLVPELPELDVPELPELDVPEPPELELAASPAPASPGVPVELGGTLVDGAGSLPEIDEAGGSAVPSVAPTAHAARSRKHPSLTKTR